MSFEFLPQISIAILVFISTNVDDIFLLAAFFADKKLTARTIVFGQLLGIGALVAVSALVAWLSMALPEGWISLLGFVPLYLGLKQIQSLWSDSDDSVEDDEIQGRERQMEGGVSSQLLAVAGVTIANGGDNIGVYIPLFANSLATIPLFVFVFGLMTLFWCFLGHVLVNNKLFGHWIRRYGHKILPIVLIYLGIDILRGALVLL